MQDGVFPRLRYGFAGIAAKRCLGAASLGRTPRSVCHKRRRRGLPKCPRQALQLQTLHGFSKQPTRPLVLEAAAATGLDGLGRHLPKVRLSPCISALRVGCALVSKSIKMTSFMQDNKIKSAHGGQGRLVGKLSEVHCQGQRQSAAIEQVDAQQPLRIGSSTWPKRMYTALPSSFAAFTLSLGTGPWQRKVYGGETGGVFRHWRRASLFCACG